MLEKGQCFSSCRWLLQTAIALPYTPGPGSTLADLHQGKPLGQKVHVHCQRMRCGQESTPCWLSLLAQTQHKHCCPRGTAALRLVAAGAGGE